MGTLADDNTLKNLLKQALMEVLDEKKDVLRDLLMEAMEDTALIHAIQEGESSGEADRDEIFEILPGFQGTS